MSVEGLSANAVVTSIVASGPAVDASVDEDCSDDDDDGEDSVDDGGDVVGVCVGSTCEDATVVMMMAVWVVLMPEERLPMMQRQ